MSNVSGEPGDVDLAYLCALVDQKAVLPAQAVRLLDEAFVSFGISVPVDFTDFMANGGQIVDLLPAQYPVSMLRQWHDDRLMWTVTVSASRTEADGSTLANSRAGRSVDRNRATVIALLRLAATGTY